MTLLVKYKNKHYKVFLCDVLSLHYQVTISCTVYVFDQLNHNVDSQVLMNNLNAFWDFSHRQIAWEILFLALAMLEKIEKKNLKNS